MFMQIEEALEITYNLALATTEDDATSKEETALATVHDFILNVVIEGKINTEPINYLLLAEATELLRNARYGHGVASVLIQDCEALEQAIAKAKRE